MYLSYTRKLTLNRVKSTKYKICAKLHRVTITEGLKWDTHVNDTCTKANRTLGFLRRDLNIGSVAIKQQAYFTLVEYAYPHTQRNIYSPCNTLRTLHSFARSDNGVVIDSEPPTNRTCKTRLLFAPLAVRVHAGASTFPFYTLKKPLIQLYIKNKTVLFPKL